MDNPIPIDLGRIAQDLQIRRVQVESVVQLLDAGNTVPFITRYRKEQTGNLNEVVIFEIEQRVKRLRDLVDRKHSILKTIEAQGKLTEDLSVAIRGAETLKRLEDLYLPFKPKKRTKATEARERGLEPLAFRVWTRDDTLIDLNAAAQEMVDPEKGVDTVEKVLEGVGHILAEAVSEMAAVRDAVRKVVWKTGKIATTKAEIPEGQGLEYRDYFNYSEPISQIPPHRVLAINRGDKEGPLSIKLEVSRGEAEAALFSQLPLDGHPHAEIFRTAALDSLDRLLLPSMEREVRRDLTEAAERHAVEVFARNLRGLLLQPPIPKQMVLAIDPGFRTGCKVAVLDRGGELLEQVVIFPHPPQNRRNEAKLHIKNLVVKHQVGVVAIGNGTACRETEEFIAEIIAEGERFLVEAPILEDGTRPGLTVVVEEPPTPAEVAPAVAEGEPAPAASEPTAELVETAEGPVAVASSEAETPGESEPAPEAAIEIAVENPPPITGGSQESGTPEVEAPGEPHATLNEHHEPTATASPEPSPAPAAEDHAPAQPTPESKGTSEASPSPDTSAVGSEPGTATPAVATPPLARGGKPRDGSGSRSGGSRSRSGRSGQGKNDPNRSRPPRPKQPQLPETPPAPHPADPLLAQLAYIVVNEAGASVYSTSQVGREELPDHDATLRSAISIGRRVQDPLAELVKIEPQNIGVGLYQHDVNVKQLKEMLDTVTSSCVNFVGVDLNMASLSLLRHVSGLNQLTARHIIEHRKEHGPFRSREELVQIPGIGPVSYTQAAGFLKIPEAAEPLDRTWIHPESYPAARALLAKVGASPEVVRDKEALKQLRETLAALDPVATAAELGVGEFTLRDILEALSRPERDPRDDLPKPIFKKGVLKIEDLTVGMELKGTVLNVVDFGAFVDIGLKDSGLVHISQLANRYIKSPHDVVTVGDVVTVWVMGIDNDRKRVSLTMVKPGTERPRGPRPDGRRESAGDSRERGPRGGRPAPAQRPTPPSSSLTMPPVGAAALTELRETPPRRPDRGGRPDGPSRPGDGRPGEAGPRGPRSDSGQGRGGPGRGGPRFQGDQSRPPRDDRPSPAPRKSSAPLPPLSQEALTGSTPLRSFGQLKQLWQARTPEEVAANAASSAGARSGGEGHATGGPGPNPNEQPRPSDENAPT